jgi:hypothetical protein
MASRATAKQSPAKYEIASSAYGLFAMTAHQEAA